MKTRSILLISLMVLIGFIYFGTSQSLKIIDKKKLDPKPIRDGSGISQKDIKIVDIPHGPESTNQTAPCCNNCPKPKITVIPKITYKKKIVYIPYPQLKPIPGSNVLKCPEGFKKVGKNKCLRIIRTEQTCPPGFTRTNDTTCTKIFELDYNIELGVKCPKGSTYNEKTKKCDKITVIKEPDPLECPSGYKRKGLYHCIKIIECPKSEGFQKITRDGKTYCMKKEIKCPRGYKRVDDDRCIKLEVRCPKGTTYSKKYKACLKKIVIIKEFKCPKGFTKVGKSKCVPSKCLTVKCKKPKCPKGKVSLLPRGECCYVCRPCACSYKFKPVCGDDGITYTNSCTAKCLKVVVRHSGKCKEPPLKKCIPKKINIPCEQKCRKNYSPVCGEGQITFMNRCIAKCLEQKIVHVGACQKKITVCKREKKKTPKERSEQLPKQGDSNTPKK